MLKAIPKTSIIVKLRRNSCLYPSFAVVNQIIPIEGSKSVYQGQQHPPRWSNPMW